jgi:hypothetical protein
MEEMIKLCQEEYSAQFEVEVLFFCGSHFHLEPLALPQWGATYGLRTTSLDKAHIR